MRARGGRMVGRELIRTSVLGLKTSHGVWFQRTRHEKADSLNARATRPCVE